MSPKFLSKLPEMLVREIEEGRAAVVGGAVRAHFDGGTHSDIDVFVFSKENYDRLVQKLGGQEVSGTGGWVHKIPNAATILELVFDADCPDAESCIRYSDTNIGSGTYSAGKFSWDESFLEAVRTRVMRIRLPRVQNPQRTYSRCIKHNAEYGYGIDDSIHGLLKLWKETTT